MTIKIIDRVGIDEVNSLILAQSLIKNRPPKLGSFDYGLETHGVFGLNLGVELNHPIQVCQTNKRKSASSPIEITIEKHTPIF